MLDTNPEMDLFDPPLPPMDELRRIAPPRKQHPPSRAALVITSLLALVVVMGGVILFRAVFLPPANATGDRIVDGAAILVEESSDAWTGMLGGLQDIAAAIVEPLPVVATDDGTASVLFTLAGDDGRGVAFALLADSPDGPATMLLLPPDLLGIQPGYGDFPLSDSLRFEGPDLAAVTITNLLGLRVDAVVALQPGQLERALPGRLTVDLPVPLVVAGDDGVGDVVAAEGEAVRSAAEVERILATAGTGDQLDWLQRQGAVWSAVLAAVGEDPGIAQRMAASTIGEASLVTALLGGAAGDDGFTLTTVPVSRVSVGGSGPRYALDGTGAHEFVAQRLGALLIRPGDRPRVELLNGNGRIGTTRLVARELVRRGYRVVKTDNADSFRYETTKVVAHGRDNQQYAREVLGVLGEGDLLLEVRNPSGVVDISVIVGADIPVGE